MTTETLIRTTPMPEEMQLLLSEYPRDAWAEHPNFKRATEQWMGAHQMFRKLAAVNRTETEAYLDKSRDPDDFAGRLSVYGNLLVRNLHGHHHWEDHSYFPELSAADPRFDAGLDILEKDHEALDSILDDFTRASNRVIKLIQLDEAAARDEAGAVHKIASSIEKLLERHLTDEEDLAVPIILHHKLRG
ncbi:MAG: hemerythrin domain-containing protein [Boseongicola sp.]|nr:hemerythrin domain-containing protein [Boseongicola sp.]MDD9977208.1 hemerythrin domain-containing protein [Boseongicola sp.]